jgi:hypothetical protein
MNNRITLVTGLWDINRSTLSDGWNRSYSHYLDKFKELLETPYNLIIFGDEDLINFAKEIRVEDNTQYVLRTTDFFTKNEFYEKIQDIRINPEWYGQVGWLSESTQASLELYNPLVMSKMFLLNDAKILDKFDSDYMFWVDAGLTNTVHKGYFTSDILDDLPRFTNKFTFICYPYETKTEIHGFKFDKMCEFAKSHVDKVGRGGFFGGPKETIGDVNSLYYSVMSETLNEGCMGTEESLFSILLYRNSDMFNYFLIKEDGLIYNFFEDLTNKNLTVKNECVDININDDLSVTNTALYVITFNSPKQFNSLLKSMDNYDNNLLKKTRKYLLDNSTDESTFDTYQKICLDYNFIHIKKDNLGITGGRQFIAEHAHQENFDFYWFFEDDMEFYSEKTGVCRNGFNRYVPNLFNNAMSIIKKEGFDFLKLNFSEFYGDNSTQFSWYNVPGEFRRKHWPKKPTLPVQGLDPNAPKTVFNNIKSFNGIPYASGEIYLCNWPQIMTKYGNIKCYINTKFQSPFEQVIMSYVYQETIKKNISPGILLVTPTEHNRFEFYESSLRKEC